MNLDEERMNIKTLATRTLPTTLAMYRRALAGADDKPCVTGTRWAPPGARAILVGAGPSLDDRREWVAEQRAAGALVVAVAPAGRAMGWEGVDVGVSVETVEQPGTVPPPGVRFVVDLGVSDAAWDRADGWFSGCYPYHMAICEALGVQPLLYPGNVGPAALALVLEWGFRDVVMVGFDLAYTGGRAYAEGAPWAATSAQVSEDGTIQLGHVEERHQAHDAAGSARIPAQHRGIERPAWDGSGTVYTTADYAMQADAMGRMARQHREAQVLNATGGGLAIEGIPSRRVSELPELAARAGELPALDNVPRADGGEQMRRRFTEEAARFDDIVTDEMSMGGTQGMWRNILLGRGCPLLSQLVAIGIAQVRMVDGMTLPERLNATYEVMHAAARMAGQVMSEVPGGPRPT